MKPAKMLDCYDIEITFQFSLLESLDRATHVDQRNSIAEALLGSRLRARTIDAIRTEFRNKGYNKLQYVEEVERVFPRNLLPYSHQGWQIALPKVA